MKKIETESKEYDWPPCWPLTSVAPDMNFKKTMQARDPP